MPERQIVVRLTARGGKKLKEALRGAAEAGERGFKRLSREMDLAGRRLERYGRRARRAALRSRARPLRSRRSRRQPSVSITGMITHGRERRSQNQARR